MHYYLVGIATDEKGNELKENGKIIQSVYAFTNKNQIAIQALQIFRENASEDRSTIAPGSIATAMDQAFQKEMNYRNSQKETKTELSDILQMIDMSDK